MNTKILTLRSFIKQHFKGILIILAFGALYILGMFESWVYFLQVNPDYNYRLRDYHPFFYSLETKYHFLQHSLGSNNSHLVEIFGPKLDLSSQQPTKKYILFSLSWKITMHFLWRKQNPLSLNPIDQYEKIDIEKIKKIIIDNPNKIFINNPHWNWSESDLQFFTELAQQFSNFLIFTQKTPKSVIKNQVTKLFQ